MALFLANQSPLLLESKNALRSFFVPARYKKTIFDYSRATICAIIPTYAPDKVTKKLVDDILSWNPKIAVYVVDDSTPYEQIESHAILQAMAGIARVTLLRTDKNALKAGALNYALRYISENAPEYKPDVILTADDDIVIEPSTIRNLVIELMSHDALGAACSQCGVFNKNVNLLTRLQALEYIGFNAIRLADEGFLYGPLVMHGMLTAFRAHALAEVDGFTEGHLIEDYEITTRLKMLGWSVKSVLDAPARTVVPETLSQFWKQRTRWSYGGITVVVAAKRLGPVFQDVLGHVVFLTTIGMVLALLFFGKDGTVPSGIINIIVAISFVQLSIWYVFQLWLMRSYREKDWIDWAIRVTLLPEFVYGYLMTIALIGSYCFFIFNTLAYTLRKQGEYGIWLADIGSVFFRRCGYRRGSWGTRAMTE
jgi:cellulose synthase/poly-beta-1,6-N-acetylglucosamine synthase-like glycosyltransferase